MSSIPDRSVSIQTGSRVGPFDAPWFGEVALLVRHLDKEARLRRQESSRCALPAAALVAMK